VQECKEHPMTKELIRRMQPIPNRLLLACQDFSCPNKRGDFFNGERDGGGGRGEEEDPKTINVEFESNLDSR